MPLATMHNALIVVPLRNHGSHKEGIYSNGPMAAITVGHDGEITPPRNFHHWFVEDGEETGET